MTFQIQVQDGRRIPAPITAQHFDTILEAFNSYQQGLKVLFQGVGIFDRSEKLLKFEFIEHMSLLDPLDIDARLDELRSLQDGWLEGKGVAPSSTGLEWFSSAFNLGYLDDLPLPYLYPTVEGNIQAEWSLKPHEISLEVDLESHAAEWHGLHLISDAETVRELDLD